MLTDANGNLALQLNSHALTASGAPKNTAYAMLTVNNVAQQFNPVTGIVAAAGASYYPGPFYKNPTQYA